MQTQLPVKMGALPGRQALIHLTGFVVYCFIAFFVNVCLMAAIPILWGTVVHPSVIFSADSTTNNILGFLLYPLPVLVCLAFSGLTARKLSWHLYPRLQHISTAWLISITTLSTLLTIIFAFIITFIGLVALALWAVAPTEQVTTQIPGYTVRFYQETDLEFTTLAVELQREDGYMARETIASNDETICRGLAIKRDGEQLHLICDRVSQFQFSDISSDIDIERKEILIKSDWRGEVSIPFDELYFYKP